MSDAEYHQFGRNTATTCRATFLTVLASKTHDPQLIAAAERGRREVLEVNTTDAVQILIARDPVILARVRDDFGIHDVTHGSETGWRCSCAEAGPCAHQLAVRQLTGVGS